MQGRCSDPHSDEVVQLAFRKREPRAQSIGLYAVEGKGVQDVVQATCGAIRGFQLREEASGSPRCAISSLETSADQLGSAGTRSQLAAKK